MFGIFAKKANPVTNPAPRLMSLQKYAWVATPFAPVLRAARSRREGVVLAREYAVQACLYVRANMPDCVPFSPVLAFCDVYREDTHPECRDAVMEICADLLRSGLFNRFIRLECRYTPASDGIRREADIAGEAGLPVYEIAMP